MGLRSSTVWLALLLLLYCFCLELCTAVDTITPSLFIKDPEAIISSGSIFKLGFFSPGNSSYRYVGIWYNDIPAMNVIWVANRNKPLEDSSGIVTISEDGNLVVLNGQKEILWSSNITNSRTNSSAQLLDTGNLVLKNSTNGIGIWESFQNLSDSFSSKMKISSNARTGERLQITSWKSPSDPSVGSFSAGISPLNIPEVFVWNDSRTYWRSGPWNGQIFIGIPDMNSVYLDGFNLLQNEEGTYYLSYVYANETSLSNFVIKSNGTIEQIYWEDGMEDWEISWMVPQTKCDVYGKCGTFGNCDAQNSPICSCLKGFEPKNTEEWSRGNWTSGCIRRKPLQCERIRNGSDMGKEDGFFKLEMVKVPDFAEWSSAFEDKCKDQCLNNCSCMAYAYDNGIGCMLWNKNLLDIQKFSSKGADLYIRLAYSELDKKKELKTVIIPVVILGIVTIAICTFFFWRWIAKRREILSFNREETNSKFSSDILLGDNMNQVKLQELPLFNFEKLATATNNFNPTNKLGQGGFGPVYRGKLQDGREIAVKRLSRASGQGLEEFMNEMMVISKLQHRNLVRIFGCCVEGEEKMLVYEYMPNKSLDAFLFDPIKHESLNWRKRFSIIEGIGRGLLYLHRDSRLRIIHRDLKASNILLDEELNPKISDFGMARIFGGNENHANTLRVVGTYGYMSPEYAMEGRLSEKSDVFSFGVLLLEIVSGRRNTSFYNDEKSLSLLGYAWKLWNEDNVVALTDQAIFDPCFHTEILRSIHVGLLCVQHYPEDRPTVSTVISMLNSEIVDLPTPNQPAFTERRIVLDTEYPQLSQNKCSINDVTVTMVQGR